MFNLFNRFTILVPQTDNQGNAFSDKIMDAITFELQELTRLCGGYTATMHEGAWYSEEEQRLMIDQVKGYEFFYHLENRQQRKEVSTRISNIVFILIQEGKQESVAVRYNDKLSGYGRYDSMDECLEHIKYNLAITFE